MADHDINEFLTMYIIPQTAKFLLIS